MSGTVDAPTEYATPDLRPTLPGADWFIDGTRYSEVGRATSSGGGEQIHLRLAAAAS